MALVIPRSVDLLLKQLDSSFWDVTLVAIRCLGQLYPYILSVLYVMTAVVLTFKKSKHHLCVSNTL